MVNEMTASRKDVTHDTTSSSFRAADRLSMVGGSSDMQPLRKSSLSASTVSTSFSTSTVDPYSIFARKAFKSPQIINIEGNRKKFHTDDAHYNHEKVTQEEEKRHGANIRSTYNLTVHGQDVDREGILRGSVSISNDSLSGGDDFDTVELINARGGKKKPWIWERSKSVSGINGTEYADVQRRRRRGTSSVSVRRRRRRSIEESERENNDDGWRSVRKRSLLGSIFSSVNDSQARSVSQQLNLKLLSKRKAEVKFGMSRQQTNVLLAISSGKSIFITGSAGTGKSYLLNEAVNTLRNMYSPTSVFVTASTGLAACAIGGTTLHSFAGIGLGIGEKGELARKVATKRDAKKRWSDCKALIIDEISMIDGELFDKLEYIARSVRGPYFQNKVFGGIQLVVTGDFFQLPPVHPENPEKYFAFQADCWNDCFEYQVELTQVFRQSDLSFVQMLNELRRGQCSSVTSQNLTFCDRPVRVPDSGILMTKLYPRKLDVNKENEQNLRSLNQKTVAFLAEDESKSEFAMRQLENVMAEKKLLLSVGAQVMLIKNVESGSGLVNGARGVVVRFASINELEEGQNVAKTISPSGLWPVVLFACDGTERLLRPETWSVMDGTREVASRTQIPLVLAWALSVHKCQGMTLDRVEIDLSKSFEYGMVYVALSRVKSLEGLKLTGFDPSLVKVHPKVVQFYNELTTCELS
ncbi:hypothetical protein KP509_39G012100 [Ceratopteris richardii]|nr:hypothetical protein KP509_39G012100 [Ceratopteris richardii]